MTTIEKILIPFPHFIFASAFFHRFFSIFAAPLQSQVSPWSGKDSNRRDSSVG
jgi:hypothetical protein